MLFSDALNSTSYYLNLVPDKIESKFCCSCQALFELTNGMSGKLFSIDSVTVTV